MEDLKNEKSEAAIQKSNAVINQEIQEEIHQIDEETSNSFEVCIGIGTNQLFPEYIQITLDDGE